MWSRGWTVAIPQYLTGQPYAVGSGIKAGSHLLFTVSDDGHLVAQDPAEVTTLKGPARVIWYSIQTNNMRIGQ